jgi:ABC-type bacteriocin/lantibiotic exporter with double-glycine peptidase domain
MLKVTPPRRTRLPVMLQLTRSECGAACLAMVLTYYGRHTRVGECREACDVGRDGLTALAIVNGARVHKLDASAYSVAISEVGKVRTPAILHWNGNHFVILERWTSKRVQIVDPAIGRRRLSPDEFKSSFSGTVITLQPSAEFARQKPSSRPTLRAYLMSAFMQAPGILLQVLFASLLFRLLVWPPQSLLRYSSITSFPLELKAHFQFWPRG